MLKTLSIQNYALIEKLDVDFSNGLTIITGETGAGKSILVGALSLILGERADTGVLQDKDKKCIVEGFFDVSKILLGEFFEKNDLDKIEQRYNEVIKIQGVKNHEKVFSFLTVQTMSKVDSIYNKELYLKYITRLCEISSTNNDQEMIGIAYNYLIMYYHEDRKYKKALEIAERLLRLKKIRI